MLEQDFTYTTDQNKTDDHVKRFVKPYIDQPSVELQDNAVTVSGDLLSKYADKLSIDEETNQFVVNVDMTKFAEGFVNYMITKMIDQTVMTITNPEFESTTNSQGSSTQAVATYTFKFSAGKYFGSGNLSISGIVKDGKANDCQLIFNCFWKTL